MASAASLLSLVEQAIEDRLNGGSVQGYSIAGRYLQYTPLLDLLQMRDRLKREGNADSGGLFALARLAKAQ